MSDEIDQTKYTTNIDSEYAKTNISKSSCNIWGLIDTIIYNIEQLQSQIESLETRVSALEKV